MKYNLSKIFKQAWVIRKKTGCTMSAALKNAWAEAKAPKNVVVKKYDRFNPRRYGNPWVAIVSKSGKIDFSKKVGGYTGGYNQGEAGELYINEPKENDIYAYGQKDYRGNNGGYEYVQYKNGEFVPVEKTALVEALNR